MKVIINGLFVICILLLFALWHSQGKSPCPTQAMSYSTQVIDYPTQITVGNKYTLYPSHEENPFEASNPAEVTVTDIKNGYIQYCHSYQYGKPDVTYFSRSYDDFIELLKKK